MTKNCVRQPYNRCNTKLIFPIKIHSSHVNLRAQNVCNCLSDHRSVTDATKKKYRLNKIYILFYKLGEFMSVWQQIVAFAFKGLQPSYYWRHFVLGSIVPIIIVGLNAYVGFTNPEISTGTAIIGILSYIAGALFLLILYPFSRFAYESIVDFIMGNNVIISNGLLFLTYKYISYAILLCFSFVIAPIGMIILFFYNKHQFKLAQEQAVQTTEQNQ